MKKSTVLFIPIILLCLSSCREIAFVDAWTRIIDVFDESNNGNEIDPTKQEEEEKNLGIVKSEGLKYHHQDGKYYIYGHYEDRDHFEIPDSFNNLPVTAIEWFAFENCKKLTSITIGKNVESISQFAFKGCSNLISFNIDANNTSIINDGGLIYVGKESAKCLTFCLQNVAGEITLHKDMSDIANGAFSESPSISKIKIGSGTTIPSFARESTFDLLASLQTFEVDNENSYLTDLDGVLCTKDEKELLVFPGNREGSYIIPDSISKVSLWAFKGARRLKSLTLNNQINDISFLSFISNSNIEYFEVSSNNSSFSSYGGIVYSKQFDSVLSVPSGLEKFDFYPGAKTIASYAFNTSKEIKFLDLPRSIETIKANAFMIPNLKNIVFGTSLKTIESNAFYWKNDIEKMFFEGTKEDLSQISLADHNSSLVHTKRYFYSQEKPKSKGNFWHYSDGKVTIW